MCQRAQGPYFFPLSLPFEDVHNLVGKPFSIRKPIGLRESCYSSPYIDGDLARLLAITMQGQKKSIKRHPFHFPRVLAALGLGYAPFNASRPALRIQPNKKAFSIPVDATFRSAPRAKPPPVPSLA